METTIAMTGGFAGNYNKNTIRNPDPQIAEVGHVCIWRSNGNRITERNRIKAPSERSHLSGRKLEESHA